MEERVQTTLLDIAVLVQGDIRELIVKQVSFIFVCVSFVHVSLVGTEHATIIIILIIIIIIIIILRIIIIIIIIIIIFVLAVVVVIVIVVVTKAFAL